MDHQLHSSAHWGDSGIRAYLQLREACFSRQSISSSENCTQSFSALQHKEGLLLKDIAALCLLPLELGSICSCSSTIPGAFVLALEKTHPFNKIIYLAGNFWL